MTKTISSTTKRTLSAAVTAFAVIGAGMSMAVPAQAAKGDAVNPLPPESYRYSSEFGPRCIPVMLGSTNHQGQDMATSDGTTIRAIADGIVTFVKDPSGGGSGYLAVKHVIDGKVVYSGYYHMWKASKYVKVGQKVKKGQRIGLVGNSGPSTAPHLHFEIWKNAFFGSGTAINPVNYMKTQGIDLKKDAYLVYKLNKPSSCTYFATTKTSLRSQPNASSSAVATIWQNNAMVSTPGVSSQVGNYIKVTVNGKTGWAVRNTVSPYKVKQTQPSTGSQLPSTDAPKTTSTASNVKYKTNSNLNMRSGPGTSNSVSRVLSKGTEVTTVGKKSGTWLQVKAGNVTGWVSASYLTAVKSAPAPVKKPAPVVAKKVYSATANVNFRKGAGTNHASIGIVKKGAKVTGTGSVSGKWIQVKTGSQTGWVSSAYLTTGSVTVTKPKPPVVNTKNSVSTTSNVHFRSGAGTSHKSLSVLSKGTKVTLTGKKSGTWSQVKKGSVTGWVSSTYLTTAKVATVTPKPAPKPVANTSKSKTVKANLNMRSNASMKGNVVLVLKKNTKISVVKTSGAWSQVKLGNKTGWVVSSYLK